jgi:hypothetical protein
VRAEILSDAWNCPVTAKKKSKVTMTTTVRMKLARSELTFSTPILAKIAVSAANTADGTAPVCQYVDALSRSPRT